MSVRGDLAARKTSFVCGRGRGGQSKRAHVTPVLPVQAADHREAAAIESKKFSFNGCLVRFGGRDVIEAESA